VRFLNPHTYSRNVWKILSVLQEFFNCSVGANVYVDLFYKYVEGVLKKKESINFVFLFFWKP
jgi:hypothetical protein